MAEKGIYNHPSLPSFIALHGYTPEEAQENFDAIKRWDDTKSKFSYYSAGWDAAKKDNNNG